MSCIVNAAAENISRLSEDYNIYHEASEGLQWYNQDAGHVCHEFSRPGDASLPHSMLDTCCNNWQSVINQTRERNKRSLFPGMNDSRIVGSLLFIFIHLCTAPLRAVVAY